MSNTFGTLVGLMVNFEKGSCGWHLVEKLKNSMKSQKKKKIQVYLSLQFPRQPRGHKHRNDAAGKEMDEWNENSHFSVTAHLTSECVQIKSAGKDK